MALNVFFSCRAQHFVRRVILNIRRRGLNGQFQYTVRRVTAYHKLVIGARFAKGAPAHGILCDEKAVNSGSSFGRQSTRLR